MKNGEGSAMVRGTPGVKRNRTISVRVSEAEWAAWEARREASGRKEMGAWVRAVVLDAEGLGTAGVAGSRAGDVPVVPAVNAAAYEALVGAANNLNQLTRYSHQNDALAPGVGEAVAAVVAAARAVRGRRVLKPVKPAEPVVELLEQEVQPVGPHEPVDPWVSRPRRRTDTDVEPATGPDVEADVDASTNGGTGGGSDGGAGVPVSSEGSSSVAEEERRPVDWGSMSLLERAQWLQRSGRTEEW